jgi:uncharacterized protein
LTVCQGGATIIYMSHELEKNLNLISRELPLFREKYHVEQMGIFGSVARGSSTSTSDVDILVQFSKPIGIFAFLDLEQDLVDLLGKRIDLVTKQSLKSIIRDSILSEVVYV